MIQRPQIRRDDLVFPELSYAINGVLIDVYRQLGGGHKEEYYQKAVAVGLEKNSFVFKEQFYVPLKYDGLLVGKYYLDFYIENKIVLELKRQDFISAQYIEQVKKYLSALNSQLAIIGCFTFHGVNIKRVLNLY